MVGKVANPAWVPETRNSKLFIFPSVANRWKM
jgi:hypothetical protein